MQQDLNQSYLEVLKKTFGFNKFRKGQLEAINALMTNKRLLCIQPTGHGKSLIYQLPSVLLNGLTLVISPLLALMRDQLKQLKERFAIAAASFNTDQTLEENIMTKNAVLAGKIRILFIAPEQLDSIERFNFLLSLPISLLVVDEAHCLSTWGHDFRPSYRQILHLSFALLKKSSDLRILALTATANQQTEFDIKKQLASDNLSFTTHRESMDRPNIRLTVLQAQGNVIKLATLIELLNHLTGCGLIYCATRENTELVADFLVNQGIQAAAYHAGLDTYTKQSIQNDFILDNFRVIVATNALGMGIDKSNLRFIVHYDYPGSITAYYQEVGRCGRDHLEADGILLYDPADKKIQHYFIQSSQPTLEDFQTVLNSYQDNPIAPDLNSLKRKTGMHPNKLLVVLAELMEQGFLKKESRHRKQLYIKTLKNGTPHLTRYITQYKIKNAELKAIQFYAEQSNECLMVLLRKNLGDVNPTSCKKCNVCTTTTFSASNSKDLILATTSWLGRRTIPIILDKKISNTMVGMAVLDGKERSENFIYFMRERANVTTSQLGLSDTLFTLIKECLNDIVTHHAIGCIIAIPSKTWSSREGVIKKYSSYLQIPAIFDLLSWITPPTARQGELLNNDQRKHNVMNRMTVINQQPIPKGTILLYDDYIGSGATLNEAARALREQGKINNPILPFTIAALKWRLGKKGMI